MPTPIPTAKGPSQGIIRPWPQLPARMEKGPANFRKKVDETDRVDLLPS